MATVPAPAPTEYVHQHYPKHVYSIGKTDEGKPISESQIVSSEEALDDLKLNTRRDWFESPGEAKRGKADPPKAMPKTTTALEDENDALRAQIAKLQADSAKSKKS